MPKMTALIVGPRKKRTPSFTLVELLTVIAIIAILAALTLYAGSAMMNKAARSRASAEIQAMSTALESYKTDNGIYPQVTSGMATNAYSANDGSQVGGLYQTSSQLLYLSLSGQTNFTDNPVAGAKSYMAFKANQIGNPTGAAAGGSYVQDPWRYSYGYSTGTTNTPPYNGTGFFDLWSTGGLLTAKANVNTWLSNWQ
jgi:prepilin-type N-terminal cleavage/methylation domain-containing protein